MRAYIFNNSGGIHSTSKSFFQSMYVTETLNLVAVCHRKGKSKNEVSEE